MSAWIASDDRIARATLDEFLFSKGYDTKCFSLTADQLDHLVSQLAVESRRPAVVIMDLSDRPPNLAGAVASIDRLRQNVPLIFLHDFDSIAAASKTAHSGAYDYLLKPYDLTELEVAVDRTIQRLDVRQESEEEPTGMQGVFRSSDKKMLEIQRICGQAARTDVPILILGESGVGKEVVAQHIHAQSGRSGPLAKVNCAALPADLLESELFGHERGAFTGALREKPGKFELAGDGTILLDEIAEMSPLLQAKLLHVLQDGEYSRLGATHTLKSEARILAATNKPLPEFVAAGRFREDLYFRLNVITVDVPPLRERCGDIPGLAQWFLDKYRGQYQSSVDRIPPELEAAFLRHSWPGNVRQLENVIKRFLILPDAHQSLAEMEKMGIGPVPEGNVSLRHLSAMAAERAEKEVVLRTLDQVSWNRKEAARQLKICYKSLLNKLRRWDLKERRSIPYPPDPEETAFSAAASRNGQ